ncbi:MAG: DnaJ domain-containing protein [Deltaproteobacteria bacterium]|nr:DnaJ domain-containing protein [Deltaproteobacteria bacterium]
MVRPAPAQGDDDGENLKTEVALRARPPAPPPTPTGPVPPGVEPTFAAEVETTAAQLPELDYFQVLLLQATASTAEIKRAYHQRSRAYHPDRFFRLEDAGFRENVDKIYKRINEAYVVLRDDQKRAKYVKDISGDKRAEKLRFTEESEVEAKRAAQKEKEEEVGKTPQGRKVFEQGMKDLAANKFVDAHRNFKMAVMYEPGNAKYKEKMLEAEKQLPKGDFRIK